MRNVKDHELKTLPFSLWTPRAWAAEAARDVISLLCDHAHLERKAASNALALLNRWPDPAVDGQLSVYWVQELTEVARDEINHLRLVVQHIVERGGVFPKFHENLYASDLRRLERRGEDPGDLIDRLLISALIEARSCERFFLLAEVVTDEELRKLYRGLWSSEKGHFQLFLELARRVCEPSKVDERWTFMLEQEALIIQQQRPGARIHSWIEE